MNDQPLHLTAEDLVARWQGRVKLQTLANWRNLRRGPTYIRLGRRVLYPVAAVEAWEKERTVETV